MLEISDWAKGPFAAVGSIPAFTQGDYEKGVQGLINSGGFLAYAAYRYRGSKVNQEAFKVETKILWAGIVYIMALQLLYMKATDSGKEFNSAKGDFDAAGESLAAAATQAWGGWVGDAADAYNEQSDLQASRAAKMSEHDAEITAILAAESRQVKRSYVNLGWEQTGLTLMIPICSLLFVSDPVRSQLIQLAAVVAAVAKSLDIVSDMIYQSKDNADAINAVIEKYRDLGDAAAASLQAVRPGMIGQAAMASASQTTVGQFDSLNTAAPFAAAATVSKSSGGHASRVAGAESTADRAAIVKSGYVGGNSGPASEGESQTRIPPGYPMPAGSQAVTRPSRASTPAAQSVDSTAQSPASAGGVVAQDEAAAGSERAERAPIVA
ncbi:EspA/EspE family type VII secretion system effector [Mycobacterium genavense]|uniref:EspA/EspE family type VII secretion system effector n=1 Tax=Mycobacterium genavense TaxID=36812 RepID=UPI0004701128|nr:EspA/EspE family type VII secretion system effector [Mycobacterium genavense]